MLRDYIFFPLMALIVTGIIYAALYPGQKNQLTDDAILTEGYLAEGESLKFIQASPGTSVEYISGEGEAAPYLILTAHLPRETAPPSAGIFAPLNAPYEQAFAGKTLSMTIRAKQISEMPLDQFRAGYFTAGAGDSGWNIFDLTPDYQNFSFTFQPKASDARPDLDYFGIWPDEQGEQRTMAVSQYRIDVLD